MPFVLLNLERVHRYKLQFFRFFLLSDLIFHGSKEKHDFFPPPVDFLTVWWEWRSLIFYLLIRSWTFIEFFISVSMLFSFHFICFHSCQLFAKFLHLNSWLDILKFTDHSYFKIIISQLQYLDPLWFCSFVCLFTYSWSIIFLCKLVKAVTRL